MATALISYDENTDCSILLHSSSAQTLFSQQLEREAVVGGFHVSTCQLPDWCLACATLN